MTHPAYDVTHFASHLAEDGSQITGGVAGPRDGVEYWAEVYRKRGYTVMVEVLADRSEGEKLVARWNKPTAEDACQPLLDVKNTKPRKAKAAPKPVCTTATPEETEAARRATPDPAKFDYDRQKRIVDGNLEEILNSRQFLYETQLTDRTKTIIRQALERAYMGGYTAH